MPVVTTAKSYLNKVIYVFGADDVKNGKGDCSSFVKTVFADNGITIGRDTESQWTGAGTTIPTSSLSSGDLVFFKNTYASNHTDGVSHVGIYEGNGMFIHLSSGAGTVVESDLSAPYWQEHFLGAKRVTNFDNSTSATPSDNTPNDITNTSLVWWGDIVKVVLIVLLIIAGLILATIGIKQSI